jgi:Fic family protein
MDKIAPITLEQAAELDALYRPFPSFDEWSGLQVDENLWSTFVHALEEEKSSSAESDLRSSLETATRAAALDTGAIEGLYQVDRGFTMTVAARAATWEVAMEERGTDVQKLFAAQLEGYETVLDLATGQRPVTEAWVRQLHQILCGPQDTYSVYTEIGIQEIPLPKGQYKIHPNHVREVDGAIHAYAPVAMTPPEMERFVGELRSGRFEEAHPISQASYAHYALVAIHPFADGNGRVARALASIYFYRSASIPLLIWADQRSSYLETLWAADRGDHQMFVNFVRDRGIDTMNEVTLELRLAKLTPMRESLTAIRELMTGQGGLTHQEIDGLAERIVGRLAEEAEKQFGELSLPKGVGSVVSRGNLVFGDEPDYRPLGSGQAPLVQLRIESPSPAKAQVVRDYFVVIARRKDAPFPFLVRDREGRPLLEARIADVYPEETASFRRRAELSVRALLADMLGDLRRQAKDSVNQTPYRAES